MNCKTSGYFDNNLDFYKYYRTGSNFLDHKYFVRGKYDIRLTLDTFYFETDPLFSTSHDYKVAKIIANDLLQVYLEDTISSLERKYLFQQEPSPLQTIPESGIWVYKLYDNRIYIPHAITYSICFLTYPKVKA